MKRMGWAMALAALATTMGGAQGGPLPTGTEPR
jgi:hypothetical protein